MPDDVEGVDGPRPVEQLSLHRDASGVGPGELVDHEDQSVARAGYRDPMAEKKGKGSDTAQKANAKAAKEGKKNPRKSSAAQSELGKKGGKTQKKSKG